MNRGSGSVSGFRFPVSCLLLLACGATTPPSARPPPAVLLVRAPAPDASLWVDETLVGDLGALPGGVELRPGDHRVEVRHDRYHTRYFRVTLAPGEKKTVDVTLAEELP